MPAGSGGYLVIRKPWPSMLRTIYGDPERYEEQYWSQIPGTYFTGDGARRDEDGYIWVMGRVDDVINVSGHRLSTMEVESALVAHPHVAEAAVVARPDEIKGSAIVAFVTFRSATSRPRSSKPNFATGWLRRSDRWPSRTIFASPILLPKTRSGKIMRRLLRELAAGGEVKGDVTTLEDLTVLAKLRQDED